MSARVRHSARAALACVAVAALVSAGSAVAGQARGAAPVTSYTDASGDGNGAPDLTGVTVSNDAAGAVTMRITVPNRPQLVSNDVIGVWIDADRNELTGPYEFRILKFPFGAVLERWDGSDWVLTSSPGSLVIGWQSTELFIAFNRADLGIGAAFGFSAAGIQIAGDDPNAWPWDDAPDLGSWTYTFVFAPTLGPAKVQPARPKAGRLVSVSVPVQAGGASVDTGTVKCSATVGVRRVRTVASGLNAGAAGCSWRLPAGTTGKTLRGAVTVVTAGGTASKTFTVKVR